MTNPEVYELEKDFRRGSAPCAAREATHGPMIVPDRHDYERSRAAIRAQLGAAAFDTAWAQGRALPLEQAPAEAIGPADLLIGRWRADDIRAGAL